jgi:hypothetical protein
MALSPGFSRAYRRSFLTCCHPPQDAPGYRASLPRACTPAGASSPRPKRYRGKDSQQQQWPSPGGLVQAHGEPQPQCSQAEGDHETAEPECCPVRHPPAPARATRLALLMAAASPAPALAAPPRASGARGSSGAPSARHSGTARPVWLWLRTGSLPLPHKLRRLHAEYGSQFSKVYPRRLRAAVLPGVHGALANRHAVGELPPGQAVRFA